MMSEQACTGSASRWVALPAPGIMDGEVDLIGSTHSGFWPWDFFWQRSVGSAGLPGSADGRVPIPDCPPPSDPVCSEQIMDGLAFAGFWAGSHGRNRRRRSSHPSHAARRMPFVEANNRVSGEKKTERGTHYIDSCDPKSRNRRTVRNRPKASRVSVWGWTRRSGSARASSVPITRIDKLPTAAARDCMRVPPPCAPKFAKPVTIKRKPAEANQTRLSSGAKKTAFPTARWATPRTQTSQAATLSATRMGLSSTPFFFAATMICPQRVGFGLGTPAERRTFPRQNGRLNVAFPALSE